MKREIKFRAWTGEKMVQVEKLTLWPGSISGHCVSCGNHYGASHGALMQFTGFRDKTGNDIFEGDIVSDENGTTAIEWAEGVGAWGLLDSDHCMFMLADCNETMEVIGNIYETPELLTN